MGTAMEINSRLIGMTPILFSLISLKVTLPFYDYDGLTIKNTGRICRYGQTIVKKYGGYCSTVCEKSRTYILLGINQRKPWY